MRVVPYFRLRDAANRIFPARVQDGLAPYAEPGLADLRARYADRLRREVARLYREWPFDVFVLPSDTFYYVRDLPSICHSLGVPVFVAQKETTITDETFERHAPDLGAYAPFVSHGIGGFQTAVAAINDAGGVNGRQIKLNNPIDAQSTPTGAQTAARQAVGEAPIAIGCLAVRANSVRATAAASSPKSGKP